MIELLTLVGAVLIWFTLLLLFLTFLGSTCIHEERILKHMEIVYATLIINGRKSFKDVPGLIKEKVRQVLIDLDLEELTEE